MKGNSECVCVRASVSEREKYVKALYIYLKRIQTHGLALENVHLASPESLLTTRL